MLKAAGLGRSSIIALLRSRHPLQQSEAVGIVKTMAVEAVESAGDEPRRRPETMTDFLRQWIAREGFSFLPTDTVSHRVIVMGLESVVPDLLNEVFSPDYRIPEPVPSRIRRTIREWLSEGRIRSNMLPSVYPAAEATYFWRRWKRRVDPEILKLPVEIPPGWERGESGVLPKKSLLYFGLITQNAIDACYFLLSPSGSPSGGIVNDRWKGAFKLTANALAACLSQGGTVATIDENRIRETAGNFAKGGQSINSARLQGEIERNIRTLLQQLREGRVDSSRPRIHFLVRHLDGLNWSLDEIRQRQRFAEGIVWESFSERGGTPNSAQLSWETMILLNFRDYYLRDWGDPDEVEEGLANWILTHMVPLPLDAPLSEHLADHRARLGRLLEMERQAAVTSPPTPPRPA